MYLSEEFTEMQLSGPGSITPCHLEKRLEIQESFEVESSQDQNISNLVGSAIVFFQNK